MQEDPILRGYELCLIFHPETADSEITTIVNGIDELIVRYKGSVLKHEKWGKKNLKYPIKKQTKGYYYFLYFMVDPPVLQELDRLIRYNEAIMRYAVMALDKNFSPEQLSQQTRPGETTVEEALESATSDTSEHNQSDAGEA